jgi:tetratricopeptide (TPR) repeat protein
VLERNRAAKDEIQQRMAFAQSIIDKATADREAILRDMDYARRVAVLRENLAQEYMAQGNNQQAMECLEQALRLHTILHGEDSEEAARIKHIIDGLKDENL